LIPKTAYFYWNKETPLSYLRFLTLKTFRSLHPHWEMKICHTNTGSFKKWPGIEQQDFLFDKKGQYDYISRCPDLGVNITDYGKHKDKAPNFISDFYRWDVLSMEGGWYFDVDQIVLRNFDNLCDHDFVADGSNNYFVGVIGCSSNSPIASYIYQYANRTFNPDYYCCIGPWMMRGLLHGGGDPALKKMMESCGVMLDSGARFYPIVPDNVNRLYNETVDIPEKTYCIHWYGGHPESQKFNNMVTEENFHDYNNTITKYAGKVLG
jgi:hypothetical protein